MAFRRLEIESSKAEPRMHIRGSLPPPRFVINSFLIGISFGDSNFRISNFPQTGLSKGGDSREISGRFTVRNRETRGRKEGDSGGALGALSTRGFDLTPCQSSSPSSQTPSNPICAPKPTPTTPKNLRVGCDAQHPMPVLQRHRLLSNHGLLHSILTFGSAPLPPLRQPKLLPGRQQPCRPLGT